MRCAACSRRGGNHEVEWPIRTTLSLADKAVGLTVMTDLYERMRVAPVSVDLAALWTEMGIERTEAGLVFHSDAPLATERVAITTRPAAG